MRTSEHSCRNSAARVPEAGLYHYSYLNLPILLRKKRRDMSSSFGFLSTFSERQNKYVNFQDARSLAKVCFWTFFANLVPLGVLVGFARAIRSRDFAGLLYPVVALLITDYVVLKFLLDPKGKRILCDTIASLASQGLKRLWQVL